MAKSDKATKPIKVAKDSKKSNAGRIDKWEEVKVKLPMIKSMAMDGKTNKEIAEELEISLSTFYNYKNTYDEFLDALKRNKKVADGEVKTSLFKRAIGYEYEEVTEIWKHGILEERKVVKKFMPPDTTAQIFWLKNRLPEEFRDKQVVEQEGEKEVVVKLEGDLEKYSV